MTDGTKPAGQKAERERRLQAALRENLKRRKAQARARSKGRDEPGETHDSAGIPVDDKT